jgi:hypothetical protein
MKVPKLKQPGEPRINKSGTAGSRALYVVSESFAQFTVGVVLRRV